MSRRLVWSIVDAGKWLLILNGVIFLLILYCITGGADNDLARFAPSWLSDMVAIWVLWSAGLFVYRTIIFLTSDELARAVRCLEPDEHIDGFLDRVSSKVYSLIERNRIIKIINGMRVTPDYEIKSVFIEDTEEYTYELLCTWEGKNLVARFNWWGMILEVGGESEGFWIDEGDEFILRVNNALLEHSDKKEYLEFAD